MIYTTITPEVESIITRMCDRWGTSAEHTLHCYENNITNNDPDATPIVMHIEEDDTGILASYEPKFNCYRIHVEILSPKTDKVITLQLFLDTLFKKDLKAKKVWLENETETRKSIVQYKTGIIGYKINRIYYTLIWPVFDLTVWNGAQMQGGDWKDMRYYWNKFHKEHNPRFIKYTPEYQQQCINLLYKWMKERKTNDAVARGYYERAIATNFEGYETLLMLVDNKVVTMTAGFTVRPGYYYSSIGLYDPSLARCNDIANMDDLINLKRLGHTIVDFGGVEKTHLEFKKKFRPTRYYKTHVYSIERKNEH